MRHSHARQCPIDVAPAVRHEIRASLPHLRAFARILAHEVTSSDDLVRDTIVEAWSQIGRSDLGMDRRAWLFKVLRNHFYSSRRNLGRAVRDIDGKFANRLANRRAQWAGADLRDFRNAFAGLPDEQREALTLVGASGFSYEEAAVICGCAEGTVKRRVHRARSRLAEQCTAMDTLRNSRASNAAALTGWPPSHRERPRLPPPPASSHNQAR